MNIKKILILLSILFVWQNAFTQVNNQIEDRDFVFNPDISVLRKLSAVIPGDMPTQLNIIKIAETIRPASVVVKGEDPNKKMILARTVYQLQYPIGNIMLDSGMDLETHRTFGKTEEPYFPESFEIVKKALKEAKMIILTHYHADHVGGVVCSDSFNELAYKTWVSEKTADLLVNKPHKETTRISQEQVNQFIIGSDQEYMPIAPGIVLMKAPGHTPDSKMIYIKLANGKEFIHSVDSGWSMENIRKEKMKNASWVAENEKQLAQQYSWLNKIEKEEKDIIIICTHDNEQYEEYTKNNILGKGLNIKTVD